MVRHPQQSSPARLTIFSESEDPALFTPQFWAFLVKYRPLFLVGLLWLVIICIASVAYSRLMFTGVPPQADINHAPTPSSLTQDPVSSLNSGQNTPPPEGLQAARMSPLSPDRSESTSTPMTIWVLGSVVGLCALGSLAISRIAQAPPRPRRPPSKLPVPKRRPPRASAEHPKPKPQRLAPFSPTRDSLLVSPSQRFVSQDDRPQPLATGPQASPGSPPASKPLPQPLAQSKSSPEPVPAAENIAIVPADESHPLDWGEASVAHTLDLRQRRSLSSFM